MEWIATLEPIIPIRLVGSRSYEKPLQDAPGRFVVCFEENFGQAPWNTGDACLTATPRGVRFAPRARQSLGRVLYYLVLYPAES